MTPLTLIFTLSAIGISETVYLIRTRKAAELPICPIGGGCAKVLTSKWSKIFFVPNDVLGLTAYLAIALFSAFILIGVEPIKLWGTFLELLVIFSSIASLFFTYIQKYVLKTWCFWCLMSACTIWLMGIIIIFSKFN